MRGSNPCPDHPYKIGVVSYNWKTGAYTTNYAGLIVGNAGSTPATAILGPYKLGVV